MKLPNLGIALIVTITTTAITIATKANLGKREITRCFFNISLVNSAGTATSTLNINSSNPKSCEEARAQALVTSYVTAATIASSFQSSESCPGSTLFCCATVTEIIATDPGYMQAQLIDLGEGFKKYKIAAVFCYEQFE